MAPIWVLDGFRRDCQRIDTCGWRNRPVCNHGAQPLEHARQYAPAGAGALTVAKPRRRDYPRFRQRRGLPFLPGASPFMALEYAFTAG